MRTVLISICNIYKYNNILIFLYFIMAPKKKKVKSIQRERPMKNKTQDNLEQNTNIGEGQQQVVKVVIQQPPEKAKPKRKATKPKVDKKKMEAIEELKTALKSYDQEQNKADQMGIVIPRELGVSPLKAGEIKNTDDILSFIKVINEKTQKIKELEKRKAEAPAPAPVQKPNMFLTPPTAPLRSGAFPSFIPTAGNTIQPAPAPQIQPSAPITPSTPGLVPPVDQSEIDKELAEIERSLDQAKSPEELAFEDSITQINTNIEAIRNSVQIKYKMNDRLSDDQIRAFKTLYETQRQKLIAAYVKLPKDSQDKLAEVKASVEELINQFEERLGQIERASQGTGGDPIPPVPPPSPDVENAKNIIEAYITQKPKPNNYGAKISNAFKILGATDAQLQVIQNGLTKDDRRRAAAELYNELVGGRTPIPPPYVPPPKPNANKVAAKSRLIQFVNDEDIDWDMELLRDLKTINAPLTIQDSVSEATTDDDRRKILRQFLGLGPAPERVPGMAEFKKALDRFYQTYNRILGSYQTSAPQERAGLIQDIRTKNNEVDTVANTGGVGGTPIVPPTVAEQLAFEKQNEDASAKTADLIAKINALGPGPVVPPAPSPSGVPGMAAYRQAINNFNQTYNQVLGSYQTVAPGLRQGLIKDIQAKQQALNTAVVGIDVVKLTLPQQAAIEKESGDAGQKGDDLINKIVALGSGRFVPPAPLPPSDILNKSPANPTEAFALLKAYVATSSAVFTNFVGEALDLTFQGERERVQLLPTESGKKARVEKLLESSGAGPSIPPGADPGGQPRPPPFVPSDPLDPASLDPGRRRNRF